LATKYLLSFFVCRRMIERVGNTLPSFGPGPLPCGQGQRLAQAEPFCLTLFIKMASLNLEYVLK